MLKAIIQKIASWFKPDAAAVETDVSARLGQLEALAHMNTASIAAETAARMAADAELAARLRIT